MPKKFIPVILAYDLIDFQKKLAFLKKLRPKPKLIQIDVVDGRFAPWQTYRETKKIVQMLKKEKFSWEVDLMVASPSLEIKKWSQTPVQRIFFHLEKNYQEKISLRNLSPQRIKEIDFLISFLKKKKIQAGLSFNPSTSGKIILSLLKKLQNKPDCLLILGVTPGRSGQKFQPKILKKIKFLKEKGLNIPIEVDGGVNLKNLPLLSKAGAVYFAAASLLYKASNPQKIYQKIRKILSEK